METERFTSDRTDGPNRVDPPAAATLPDKTRWKEIVARYHGSDARKATWQLVNTLVPYLTLFGLMVASLEVHYALTLALAIPASLLLIRVFVLFHDCTHGSFYRSRRANTFWGYVLGVLTFTPFGHWRYEHNVHHKTSGDLDRRGVGDIWTMTVDEYLSAPRHVRLKYRAMRNPLVLFLLGPLWVFVVEHRMPWKAAGPRERASIWRTNLAIVAIVAAFASTVGWKAYVAVQLPILVITGAMGMWLFYVQHQYEGVYWNRRERWSFVDAALDGSSFYALPRWLQWMTGNIGFHHVHHLSPSIPNYELERAHRSEPLFRQVRPLGFFESFRSLGFRLWDEERGEIVGWRRVRERRRRRPRAAA